MPHNIAFRLLRRAEYALSGFSVHQLLMIFNFNENFHLFSYLQVQLQYTLVLQLGGGIVRRRSQPVCQPELLIVHAALDPIMARPALWIFTTVGYGRRHDHRMSPLVMSPLVITRLDVTW